jgi:2'-5' RNA ligase
MSADETVRAFVAIELPSEIRAWCQASMERARRTLGPAAPAVRWVNPEGIHLTLKFLGSVQAALVPVLIERLQAALAGQPALSLAVGRMGVFPGAKAPRVIWLATLGEVEALGECQRRVEAATVPLGFPGEKRPFQPHLTLGRVRETATPEERAAIGGLPSGWPPGTSPPFRVTSASLMQSRLGPGGARYSRLAEIPFG